MKKALTVLSNATYRSAVNSGKAVTHKGMYQEVEPARLREIVKSKRK